ncbi:MAG: cyclic nucleotide-binding and patatin-like phospholipase domain-containing protein [Candidatus Competibacter sp.]|nr:cyclic nucleotide-binding and patatin-like phospholipase domain-containing protein [Candidatus Competibacter sp.]
MNLTNSPLFHGCAQDMLDEIQRHMKPRRYRPDEFICRQGEAGDSLFVIQSGLVEILMQRPDSPVLLDRLRHGDILGEMALITGEPRAASAMAVTPTEALELDRDAFAAIIARDPRVLFNISHILIQRQKRGHACLLRQRNRGEAVAVVTGRHTHVLVADTIAAIQRINPEGTAVVDLTGKLPVNKISLDHQNIATVLPKLDGLLVDYRTAIVVVDANQPDIHLLVRNMDRIELILEPPEADRFRRMLGATACRINCILVNPSAKNDPTTIDGFQLLRVLPIAASHSEIAWLARHLTRKKIGLSLGAGGARGFAHIGVISILEQAGIPIDYIAGSSIGAMVGSFLAMGMNAAGIEAEMKRIWSPETVAELDVFSQDGQSLGLSKVMEATMGVVGDRTFADLPVPLTIMTADLNARQAAPIGEGRLAEALCAGITIPGMIPPYARGSQRLVDGIAIVPVPTAATRDAGADIVVAVNLLHRHPVAAWPAETVPPPPSNAKSSRNLDPVIETLIMLQLDTSVRHAAEADLVVTPRFPSLSWRAYHMADPIRDAGHRAAREQLPRLLDLIRP